MKMPNPVIRHLKDDYEKACNAYVNVMLQSFGIDCRECWWVGGAVGETLMVGDMLSLNMDEIIYIVEHDVSYDECIAWSDYNLWCHEFTFNMMNLKSWCEGAPRVPQETFDNLRKVKNELKTMVDETKARVFNKETF